MDYSLKKLRSVSNHLGPPLPDSIKALEVAEYSQYKYDADSGDEVISKTEFIDSIPFSQLLVKSKSTKKKVK